MTLVLEELMKNRTFGELTRGIMNYFATHTIFH